MEARLCANIKPMSLDEAIDHARDVGSRLTGQCGDAHRQLADWLCELRERRKVGNAAKTREALERSTRRLEAILSAFECGEMSKYINADIQDNRAALAAPARNCDRFDTKEEAAMAFAKEKKQWIPQQVLWELAPWLDWLFATETKGATDGSK